MSEYVFEIVKAAFKLLRKSNDKLSNGLPNVNAKSVGEIIDALNDTGCSLTSLRGNLYRIFSQEAGQKVCSNTVRKLV